MKSSAAAFARIVIPSPLRESLVYRIPAELQGGISIGMRVLIPLGKRKVTGIVFQLLGESPVTDVKPILAIEDKQPVFDACLLQLSQWMAQYYLAGIGQVVAAILPPGMQAETQRTLIARTEPGEVSGALEQHILAWLRQRKGRATFRTLQREFPRANLYDAIERLQTGGAVEVRETLPGRRRKVKERTKPGDCTATAPTPKLTLSPEQQHALDTIRRRMEEGGFETFLLHGVTGSGKTEVYIRAMETARERGRQSLVLIPEIALTPQLLDRLEARFPARVGVLHSALTGAERWNQWWHILRGNVDVVVGARSAVFAPLPRLGLIVVDEEHDSSYKQEEGVRYHGRDVAVVRGKLSNCPVILGSATPAIETYENCLQQRYRLLQLAQRVQDRPLPRIQMIDLRSEVAVTPDGPRKTAACSPASAEYRLISDRLASSLKDNHQRSRQSLIFLNRRGFANFLQCKQCGYVVRCSHCSVTLTLHLQQRAAYCHHCNFRKPAATVCPACGRPTLSGVGAGTEQIEQTLRAILPGARIARMDRDTTTARGSHERLIRRWERGEIDVLIGTQMITKGHDVGGVTLVGALLADLSLNLPDFRAAEKTFQLLTQVAGRAGRGNDPGEVLIQTYAPDHYAIQHLLDNDYQKFFSAEMEFRRALLYPPFCRLVQLRIDGPQAEQVEVKAKELARGLRAVQNSNARFSHQVEILGPAPAPIKKLRNRYRWQLLLKGRKASGLLEFAKHAREILPQSRAIRLHIDVDPYNML